MEFYKIGMVSDTWTNVVKTRVLRDMLTIDRLARRRGIHLVLAANIDLKPVFAGVIDVTITEDLLDCDTFRVYIDFDNHVVTQTDSVDHLSVLDRLPEDADYEVIEINRGKLLPQLIIEKDPYAGMLPENRDVEIIQPTVDLNKPPPKVPDTYFQQFMF